MFASIIKYNFDKQRVSYNRHYFKFFLMLKYSSYFENEKFLDNWLT